MKMLMYDIKMPKNVFSCAQISHWKEKFPKKFPGYFFRIGLADNKINEICKYDNIFKYHKTI